ncbi:MAG: hypothetical protein OJF58_002730 [Enhydrobacter sp.]|nr:MAG: hypothetical protein OJF58_002730 [Enhydrobacter sp.]
MVSEMPCSRRVRKAGRDSLVAAREKDLTLGRREGALAA